MLKIISNYTIPFSVQAVTRSRALFQLLKFQRVILVLFIFPDKFEASLKKVKSIKIIVLTYYCSVKHQHIAHVEIQVIHVSVKEIKCMASWSGFVPLLQGRPVH